MSSDDVIQSWKLSGTKKDVTLYTKYDKEESIDKIYWLAVMEFGMTNLIKYNIDWYDSLNYGVVNDYYKNLYDNEWGLYE